MSKLDNNLKSRSFQFSLLIISLVKSFPKSVIYWKLGDQLLRSSTSIGANIFEAISSSTRKEFIRYYEIALKSANETKYWLLLFKESQLLNESQAEKLIDEVTQISNMLAASIKTLKKKL